MSRQATVLRAVDRHLVSRILTLRYRPGRALAHSLSALVPKAKGVQAQKQADGKSVLLIPEGADPAPRMLWIHGGAFCFNAPRIVAGFASQIASALGVSVLVPRYRLAPENPYPAALDDVLAAYRAACSGRMPLLLGGDSAGGGLSLSAAAALRDAGEQLPSALYLLSPWVDLTGSGESMRTNEGKDALLRGKDVAVCAKAYAGTTELSDPRLSPINADLAGLPPTLVQVGADELFLSEDKELAARLRAAGVQVELQVFDDMWHDFALHAGAMPEADEAIKRMAAWAKPLLAQ